MNASDRWILAIMIILLDLVIFFIPLTGLAAAYVLIVRPPWFLGFVAGLYEVAGSAAEGKTARERSDPEIR